MQGNHTIPAPWDSLAVHCQLLVSRFRLFNNTPDEKAMPKAAEESTWPQVNWMGGLYCLKQMSCWTWIMSSFMSLIISNKLSRWLVVCVWLDLTIWQLHQRWTCHADMPILDGRKHYVYTVYIYVYTYINPVIDAAWCSQTSVSIHDVLDHSHRPAAVSLAAPVQAHPWVLKVSQCQPYEESTTAHK